MNTKQEVKHTPTPWRRVLRDEVWSGNNIVGYFLAPRAGTEMRKVEANREFVLRAVNSHEALVEALRDIELRLTQAKLASGIGKKKDRTQFLLGELERTRAVARAALALAEKGVLDYRV